MRQSVVQMATTFACLAVAVGGALADEPLKVGENAVEHLGTGEDHKPLVLSKYRGRYVCFAGVDHHKRRIGMTQLVELQKDLASFGELGVQVIGLLRNEKPGVEGLKLAKENTKASFPLAYDVKAKATPKYAPRLSMEPEFGHANGQKQTQEAKAGPP